MPEGIYSNMECDEGEHPPFTPQEHQTATLRYFLSTSTEKGMLLLHRLGSGKSCTSIMAADGSLGLGDILASDEIRKSSKSTHIYVITPGSLRQNFLKEYCSRCGVSPEALKDNYTFITYNYSVGERLPDMTGGLVIIDEVHNMINGVKNQSKHMTLIYNALMRTRCRILALTGTLGNNIWEFPIIGNLLKPGTFPDVLESGRIDKFAFMKNFKISRNGTVKAKNPRELAVELRGIISYFPGRGGGFYPKVIYHPPIRVRTTIPQDAAYWRTYIWERAVRVAGPPDKSLMRTDMKKYSKNMEEFIMASKYITTRKVSNMYYPDSISSYKKHCSYDAVSHVADVKQYMNTETGETATNLVYFVDKIMDSLIAAKAAEKNMKEADLRAKMGEKLWKRAVKGARKAALAQVRAKVVKNIKKVNTGWITDRMLTPHMLSDVYSRKMTALVANIVNNWNAKHMVFSFFKSKSGVSLIGALLNHCGVPTAVYSGDISDSQRESVLERFNSEANRYGKLIKAILVTDAGAEGINLLETRHVHLVESARGLKTTQAIGRAVRFRSHMVEGRTPMKPEEKVVNVWRYWTTSDPEPVIIPKDKEKPKSKEVIITDKMMVDEQLYRMSCVQSKTMGDFTEYVKKASVTPYVELDDDSMATHDWSFQPMPEKMLEAFKVSDERYDATNIPVLDCSDPDTPAEHVKDTTGITDEAGEAEETANILADAAANAEDPGSDSD